MIKIRRADGTATGVLVNREYRKMVDGNKHFMWKGHAWGIDKSILMGLIGRCDRVLIKEESTGIVFGATMTTLLKCGQEDEFGHGDQVFLHVDKWECTDRAGWSEWMKRRTR